MSKDNNIGIPKPGEQATREQSKEPCRCAVCGEPEDHFCVFCSKVLCSKHKCEHMLRQEFSDELQKENDKHAAYRKSVQSWIALTVIVILLLLFWKYCPGNPDFP